MKRFVVVTALVITGLSQTIFGEQVTPSTAKKEPKPGWVKYLEESLANWDNRFRKAVGEKRYNECLSVNGRLNTCNIGEVTKKKSCSTETIDLLLTKSIECTMLLFKHM